MDLVVGGTRLHLRNEEKSIRTFDFTERSVPSFGPKPHLGNVLKAQRLQEAGLLRGQDFLLSILTVALSSSGLFGLLLGAGGRGFVRVGNGFMEVQSRTKRERLIAAVADEPVEFTDATTKVCLTPDLTTKNNRRVSGVT